MADTAIHVEARTILNALPYFAMIMDDRHRVIEANTWFVREVADEGDSCPLTCYETMHASPRPHPDCPLIEAARTKQPAHRLLDGADGSGAIRVDVFPLEAETGDGHPLFLHLASPAQR